MFVWLHGRRKRFFSILRKSCSEIAKIQYWLLKKLFSSLDEVPFLARRLRSKHFMNAFWLFKTCVRIRGIKRTFNHDCRRRRNDSMALNTPNCGFCQNEAWNEAEHSDERHLLNGDSQLQSALENFPGMIWMRSGYLKHALGSRESNARSSMIVGDVEMILWH